MGIVARIQGTSHRDRAKRDVNVDHFVTTSGVHTGLVTLTHPLVEAEPHTAFFVSPDFGIAMNVNVAFAGTPEQIHDGLDEVLYTATAVVGTKFTFNSGDFSRSAKSEILDFNDVDLNGSVTTLNGTAHTEGVEWNAVTSNNQTATNLAASLNGQTGFSASATGQIVTVLADVGFDITGLSTNADASNQTATAQSVKVDNAAVNDIANFAKGSDLTMSSYTALTFSIRVDKNWAPGDSVELFAYDTGLGVQVGDAVALEDLFPFDEFDTWHNVVVQISDLNISTATTVDAFRLRIVARTAPGPTFYLDRIQLEVSGTPAVFTVNVARGSVFHVDEVVFSFADALDATLANAGMPTLDHNKILGLAALPSGINITRVKGGTTLFAATFKTFQDFLRSGAEPGAPWSDGTNTAVVFRIKFPTPLTLGAAGADSFTIQINDDLTGLTNFTVACRGALETPHDHTVPLV